MEHTIERLHTLQGLPLEEKLVMTKERVKAWIDHYGENGVYVSFSGGKDSTVLLDIVRKDYPNVEAVFVDTGLEFPEIRDFVNTFDNVTVLKPKMNFKDVICKYGYPMISKEVSECVAGARKYLTWVLSERNAHTYIHTYIQTDRQTDLTRNSIEKYAEQASMLNPTRGGYDRKYRGLRGIGEFTKRTYGQSQTRTIRTNIPSKDNVVNYEELKNEVVNSPEGSNERRSAALLLGMVSSDGKIQKNIPDKDYTPFSQERYKFFLNAPFNISPYCCKAMKKKPAADYHKKTGKVPITAQMAAESRLRTQVWLKQGCNAFDSKKPISNPMSFWTEQDVLLYIKKNNLSICSVYGDIKTDDEEEGQLNFADMGMMGLFELGNVPLHTTGLYRTGCVFCGFGAHCEKKSRFVLIDEVSNPALRDFCMRGGAFDTDGLWKPDNRGLGYFFVLQWINIAGGFHIHIPEYDRYLKEYGNDRVYEELEKAKEIRERTKKRSN